MTDAHPTETVNQWPIFIVSLADATARRQSIAAQLAGLSLSYTIIDAVDGRKGLSAEFDAMINRPGTEVGFGRHLTDAEYACALSHMSIYRKVRDENLPGAVVLEDDAILTPLFPEFLAAQGYTASDLVQLDHLHGDIWRFGEVKTLTPGIRLAAAARNASLTTGYTISNRGARHLLENGLPLRAPADWPVDTTIFPAMLALPRIVDHPDFETADSAIEASRANLKSSKANANRKKRFFNTAYWRRWWFKRRTKRVS